MNATQKLAYDTFREVLNPYFNEHPGAMFPIFFSFGDAIKKAGFSEAEIEAARKMYDENKSA